MPTLFDEKFVFKAMSVALNVTNTNAQDAIFIVASDDPKWCRSNINNPQFKIVFTADFYKQVESMNKVINTDA